MPEVDFSTLSRPAGNKEVPQAHKVFSETRGSGLAVIQPVCVFCPPNRQRSNSRPARLNRICRIAALHCQLQLAVLSLLAQDGIGPGQAYSAGAAFAHARTIAIYACHVTLQMTMTEIGAATGRHRSTIGYTCARVEDRRDNPAYDVLVGRIESLAAILCPGNGGVGHEA